MGIVGLTGTLSALVSLFTRISCLFSIQLFAIPVIKTGGVVCYMLHADTIKICSPEQRSDSYSRARDGMLWHDLSHEKNPILSCTYSVHLTFANIAIKAYHVWAWAAARRYMHVCACRNDRIYRRTDLTSTALHSPDLEFHCLLLYCRHHLGSMRGFWLPQNYPDVSQWELGFFIVEAMRSHWSIYLDSRLRLPEANLCVSTVTLPPTEGWCGFWSLSDMVQAGSSTSLEAAVASSPSKQSEST
ncbi:hypothetical protein KC367_g183 [Hortaea werneckii]|nr:hypothetical protein KC367_g183 [Hortaea werneckii]